MLEIITINKDDNKEYNDIHWKDLVIDSFNNFHKQNDYQNEINKNFEEFWSTLNVEKIHLVLRQNKYIGFFINTYNKINKEISFKLFSHPRSCPMSLRSITKAAIIRVLLELKLNITDYNTLEFVTWHPSLLQVVKQLIPDVTIHMLNSNYIIGIKIFSINEVENINTVVSKYIDITEQYNNDFYKIIY